MPLARALKIPVEGRGERVPGTLHLTTVGMTASRDRAGTRWHFSEIATFRPRLRYPVFTNVILRRLVRVVAVLACIGCLVLSVRFIFEIGAMGDLIGAYRGLDERTVQFARAQEHTAMLRLLLIQVLGAAASFVALRGKRIKVLWSPLFLVAFPASTFVACWLIVAVPGIIQSLR